VGCFTKYNQSGAQGSYPSPDGSWSQEISLDLDMVSAICPNCKIALVEANSSSFSDLGAAEDTAAALHATAISNSWGGQSLFGYDLPDSSYGSYFNHPGIAVVASSGDGGYTGYPEYPASSYYVTSVGGTSLNRDSSQRGWSETAWSGAGSGCSAYNTQPSWQSGIGTGCNRRAVADVSAVADPSTGVAVYDSFAYQGYQGWLVFGGTSVASPIIASVYALAGNAGTVNYGSYPYGHTTYTGSSNPTSGTLNDVTSGSNGSCSPSQVCTGRTGWDGPTGLGSPWGTGAF
jgi:subtilase family serine protease